MRLRPGVRRVAIFVAGDLIVWVAALVLAFLIRFDGAIPALYWNYFPVLLLLFLPIKAVWHWAFRLYKVSWRSVGLPELVNTIKAAGTSSLSIAASLVFLRSLRPFWGFPRSVLAMDFLLTLFGVGLLRISRRLLQRQLDGFRERGATQGTRILVVGAGAAGMRIVQAMEESPHRFYRPVGFVDDDPGRWGTYVRGLPVLGGRTAMGDIVTQHRVDEVLIAIPSAPAEDVRGIVECVRRAGIRRMRILPGVNALLTGTATLRDIRQVEVTDLLGRSQVTIATDTIAERLQGTRVLITGAAGSIGSELVRQVARLSRCEIVALDMNETGLFELEESVRRLVPDVQLQTLIADVRDAGKMDWVLGSVKPRVIYHAAAYKHVPLMERDVDEAVKTNVLGTLLLAEGAVRHGAETFVLVSTDKAVQPTSVMGATKRVAETIVHMLSRRGRTRFLTVRFGNVLGSRGSLVPLIQEQIRNGGPVTLTHPDMTRYFMSPTEAVLLILQVSMSERQQALYVLDMGVPVRIADLATEVIRLSGLEPDKDIPIVYTGIRPGEKLEEELAAPSEAMRPSPFPGVFEVVDEREPDEVIVRLALQQLEHLVAHRDDIGIRAILRRLSSDGTSFSLPPEQDSRTQVKPGNQT
jgi:FlaA1/EpsC-like NDP-sugar epimerase